MATKLDRFFERAFELQRELGVSNACGFVCGMLYYFLEAVGEPVKLEYGLKQIFGELMEHVWISQGSKNWDPVFCEDLPSDLQREVQSSSRYIRNPSPMALMEITRKSVTTICWYVQSENYRKLLLLAVKKPELLDFRDAVQKMTHVIYGTLVEFPSNDQCWSCERKVPLKSCGRCLIAKYCSQICQHQEWLMHKEVCVKNAYSRRP